MGFGTRAVFGIRIPIASFPFSWKKRPLLFGRFFEARTRLLARLYSVFDLTDFDLTE
jgi:hypothetical protein